MIKHDYGRLKSPYFEEKLDNGATVIVMKKTAGRKCCRIYFAHGGFLHTKELLSSKLPLGTPYFAERLVASDAFKESLKADGVTLTTSFDYSSTVFSLETDGDLYAAIKKLMTRIINPIFTEKDVDELKANDPLINASEDSLLKAERRLLCNLYSQSPIRNGFIPSKEECITIHATIIKKFMESYYVPKIMTLVFAMNEEPRTIMDEALKLRLPRNLTIVEKAYYYTELYDKVEKKMDVLMADDAKEYDLYALKFPPRKNFYEKYGLLTFSFYELMVDVFFRKNPAFLSALKEANLELKDCQFYEANEDSVLILVLNKGDQVAIDHVISRYLQTLDKNAERKIYKQCQAEYFKEAYAALENSDKATERMVSALPNHLSYTELVNQSYRLSYGSFKQFIADVMKFKVALLSVRKR